MARWRTWWRFANVEQLSTFVLITFISIVFTSLLAYSTVFGEPNLPDDIEFLRFEGDKLKEEVGGWFGAFFWLIGASRCSRRRWGSCTTPAGSRRTY